jgi:hypothetical protein
MRLETRVELKTRLTTYVCIKASEKGNLASVLQAIICQRGQFPLDTESFVLEGYLLKSYVIPS